MEKQFEILRKTRQFLISLLDGLSLEQLNKIPQGFNNNIIWNAGHIVAAQQGVCYRRAGLPLIVDEAFFDQFKPESKPQEQATEAEVAQIKKLLLSTIDDLQRDYENKKFSTYPAWTTRYGVAINSIEDVVSFLDFHDGLHVGYAMALRRCVNS
ncbi:DinB family protein [Flavisolibacter ginsenosidimutans]|uniref:DinB family protein n=1 Tax=Flavisolibacter ginsenosidimutans TaxID=661481 RepID=A0A5B8UJS2_9BACT|nr:DinB family protein [Flavisolibacter ginsenosidimutans]QEC56255.1 DinB family protein [Flavisolibacter ginsenosidimutans]